MATKKDVIEELKLYGAENIDETKPYSVLLLELNNLKEKHGYIPPVDGVVNQLKDSGEKTTEQSQNELLMVALKNLQAKIDILEKQVQAPKELTVGLADTNVPFADRQLISVPVADYDDKPTTFVTWGKGTVMSMYELGQGVFSYAPYQTIIFKHMNCTKKTVGRDQQFIHISAYKTHSKAEKEWIRKSPYYNRTIFESANQIMKQNPRLASKMEMIAGQISGMSPQDLFVKSQAYGLNPHDDINILRSNIITIESEKMLANDEKAIERQEARTLEEKLQQI